MLKSFQCKGYLLLRMACLVFICQGLSSRALAQDDGDLSFGEKDVKPLDEDSPAALLLKEGKQLYRSELFVEASLKFYELLQSEGASAEIFQPEAGYELGKALLHMGLYQGALTYLGHIVDAGETHPYYVLTLQGLVVLMGLIPSDPTLRQRLVNYKSYFPQDVPPKYRDQFAYIVGRELYTRGNYQGALELLEQISESSPFYVRASYIRGVAHVGSYDGKKAVQAFKDTLRFLVNRERAGTIQEDEEDLLELSYLAMARVFYSTGDYKKSIKYYEYIQRDSAYWPKVLFEISWAYFQIDRYNKALGNLHSLKSPFFANSYFPESPILFAVLFFYNCKYSRARYELEEFEFAYLPVKEEIEFILAQNADPNDMYKWFQDLRAGDLDESESLERILAASLDDKELLRKLLLIQAIDDELENIASLPEHWQESDFGSGLLQDAIVAREFAIGDTGGLIQARLGRIRDELVEFNINRERILFEIARAEKGDLDADLKAGFVVKRNVTDVEDLNISDEQLYWDFDGEYWKDEVGFYSLNINSECKR